MKIEVKRLNALGKYTGSFKFEYDAPADLCIVPLCKIDGKVKVEAGYEIYADDSVGVSLNIAYRITGQCSYCLKETARDIEKVYDILFVTEDDSENYYYDGVNIDLTTAVNDSILFSQPNVVLCNDCAGIDADNK